MTPLSDAHAAAENTETPVWLLPCSCDNCGAASVAVAPIDDVPVAGRDYKCDARHSMEHLEDLHWLPESVLGKEFSDVSSPICDAASEAYACYSIRSYRAAILLARSVVEAVAKDQGVSDGSLVVKINTLRERQVISPLVADTAHEIRYMGNEMAHGDFVREVTEDECNDVLNFMSVLLESVYQQPARLSRFREARERRSQTDIS